MRKGATLFACTISALAFAVAAAGSAYGSTLTWGATPGEHLLEPGQTFDLVLEPGAEAVRLQTTAGLTVDCEGGAASGLEGVFRAQKQARLTNGIGVLAGGTPCATNLGGGVTATVKFDLKPVEDESTFFLADGGKPKATLSLAEHNKMSLALSTSGGEFCEYSTAKMKGIWISREVAPFYVAIGAEYKRRKMKRIAGNGISCGKGIYFSATFAYASLSNEGFGAGYQILANT